MKKRELQGKPLMDSILIWAFGEQNYSSCAAQDPVIWTNNLVLSFVEHLLCIGSHAFLCFQQFYNGRYYNFTFLNMFYSTSKPQFSYQTSNTGLLILHPVSPPPASTWLFILYFLWISSKEQHILILKLMAFFKEIVYLLLILTSFSASAKTLFCCSGIIIVASLWHLFKPWLG